MLKRSTAADEAFFIRKQEKWLLTPVLRLLPGNQDMKKETICNIIGVLKISEAILSQAIFP